MRVHLPHSDHWDSVWETMPFPRVYIYIYILYIHTYTYTYTYIYIYIIYIYVYWSCFRLNCFLRFNHFGHMQSLSEVCARWNVNRMSRIKKNNNCTWQFLAQNIYLFCCLLLQLCLDLCQVCMIFPFFVKYVCPMDINGLEPHFQTFSLFKRQKKLDVKPLLDPRRRWRPDQGPRLRVYHGFHHALAY